MLEFPNEHVNKCNAPSFLVACGQPQQQNTEGAHPPSPRSSKAPTTWSAKGSLVSFCFALDRGHTDTPHRQFAIQSTTESTKQKENPFLSLVFLLFLPPSPLILHLEDLSIKPLLALFPSFSPLPSSLLIPLSSSSSYSYFPLFLFTLLFSPLLLSPSRLSQSHFKNHIFHTLSHTRARLEACLSPGCTLHKKQEQQNNHRQGPIRTQEPPPDPLSRTTAAASKQAAGSKALCSRIRDFAPPPSTYFSEPNNERRLILGFSLSHTHSLNFVKGSWSSYAGTSAACLWFRGCSSTTTN